MKYIFVFALGIIIGCAVVGYRDCSHIGLIGAPVPTK